MFVDPSGNHATVTGAIRQAAQATGTNFQYLLATAQVESNLNPDAKVATSSARGLFQFIEQTWLATMKEQGPALGFGAYADAIVRLPSGRYGVSDPQLYERIMNLRSDPSANALMAGAFTRINADVLTERLGRAPSEGELYVAHFFGPLGASRLIGLAESRPLTPAAEVFPAAARANPGIFYDRNGQARSASDVYRQLVRRYDMARGAPKDGVTAVADAAPVADPAAVTETLAAASQFQLPVPQEDDGDSVFHGLFHTGPRREALAPVVSALWTAPTASTEGATPQDVQHSGRAAGRGGILRLFQDLASDASLLFRGRG